METRVRGTTQVVACLSWRCHCQGSLMIDDLSCFFKKIPNIQLYRRFFKKPPWIMCLCLDSHTWGFPSCVNKSTWFAWDWGRRLMSEKHSGNPGVKGLVRRNLITRGGNGDATVLRGFLRPYKTLLNLNPIFCAGFSQITSSAVSGI